MIIASIFFACDGVIASFTSCFSNAGFIPLLVLKLVEMVFGLPRRKCDIVYPKWFGKMRNIMMDVHV